MAELPRDPRQLARDILAGKVRIEDLARERQVRGEMPAPALRQQAPAPAPRPVPPVQQRMVVQPMPRQASRRMPQMPQASRPVQRPVARPVPRAPLQVTVAPTAEPVQQTVEPVPAPVPVAAGKTARREFRVVELVRSKRALRQGIILAEVLGKPVALREES